MRVCSRRAAEVEQKPTKETKETKETKGAKGAKETKGAKRPEFSMSAGNSPDFLRNSSFPSFSFVPNRTLDVWSSCGWEIRETVPWGGSGPFFFRFENVTGQTKSSGRFPVAANSRTRIDFLTLAPYYAEMKATLTSKGQITIPIGIREKLGLKPGDQIEFDETATILVGRRVVNQAEWNQAMAAWRASSRNALAGHPWADVSVAELIDDLRGGPADSPEAVPGSSP